MNEPERPYVILLTPSQRMALLDLISMSMVGPLRMDLYVDVIRQTETRPEELLALVTNADREGEE